MHYKEGEEGETNMDLTHLKGRESEENTVLRN